VKRSVDGDKQDDGSSWPRRWQHESHGLGSIMRGYVRRLDGGDDEAAAFVRARAAHRRKTLERRAVGAGLVMAVGAAAAWVVFAGRAQVAIPQSAIAVREPVQATRTAEKPKTTPANTTPAALATSARSTKSREATPRQSQGSASVRTIGLGARPVPLAPGRTTLRGQAVVALAPAGDASAWQHGRETAVKLNEGRIDLQVRPRAQGHRFVVQASPFSFVVVGTSFSVRRVDGAVALDVSEGRVAVERGGRQIAVISKGGSWSGAIEATPAPVVIPALVAPVATPALVAPGGKPASAACAAMIDNDPGSARAAIACYEGFAARGDDLDNEWAAYEAARLWRDKAADLERARRGFNAYQARFPEGALRVEAALSLLEILPRLGRHDEALTQSDVLLALPDAAPRRAEIHLMRGDLLRTARGDRAAALAEYRAARADKGRIGDEAAYAEAICLADLGQLTAALSALDDYLARPDAGRAGEARRQRDAFARRMTDGAPHAR
jgi:hypothetical protein